MTLFKTIFSLILICLLVSGCSEKIEHSILVTKGKSRTIYPDMIGVNGNLSQYDQPWENDSLIEAVEELSVSNFRYPAGSLGNYWDWDTGWIDRNVPDSLMIKWVYENDLPQSSNTYTLENFAKGQKKLGFTPVFMLNMLSKGLEHSVKNLLRAEKLGLPIKYIELGNELYFNLPYEMSVYPTPEAYGKTCQIWIDSLKTIFPEAKYAIIGSYINRKPRHTDWTSRALKYCTNADAITFHKYSPSGIDGRSEKKRISAGTEGISDAMTATRTNPFQDIKDIQEWEISLLKNDSAYANILTTAQHSALFYTEVKAPEGLEIWATEFNMRDDKSAIRGSWANALYVSKYYEVFLNSPVTLTNIHNVTGNLFGQYYSDDAQLDFIKWTSVKPKPFSLTAGGIATALFARATDEMTQATQLNFSETKMLQDDRNNDVETLIGWLFESENSKKLMLINYGRASVNLNLSNFEDFNQSISYASELETYVTDGFESISTEKTNLQNNINLKPFSITLIQ